MTARRRRILFICTANICRSPAAEALARSRFGEETKVFRSAGFLDTGRNSPKELVQVLGDRGIDISNHQSYSLDEASIQAADVLLTMEGDHVRRATEVSREAFTKTVPIKEMAQWVEQFGGQTVEIPVLLAEINQNRDPGSYLTPQWDVDDPYKQKLKVYRRAVDEIASLVETVVGGIS